MNVIENIEGLGVGAIAADSIVNADCLEAMKLIPDKSIDCIICDLPYGITACKWDVVIPFEPLWEQYKRIIKPNGAIALFGSQPFTSALVMSNPKWFKYEWIWDKQNPTNFALARKQPLKYHENILIFGDEQSFFSPIKTKGKINHIQGKSKNNFSAVRGNIKRFFDDLSGLKYPRSIIEFSKHTSQIGLHPTQKPVALIEYLIKTYTQEGELILDNTAGSGTLAIAAINTNRRYICIEKDEHYFEVMRDRIANHDPNAPIKTKKPPKVPKGQLTLFN